MSLIKLVGYLLSPLVMLVVALLFFFIGMRGTDPRFLYFAISIVAWLTFSRQLQKRKSYQAFWPWMIGQFRAKNALIGLGLAGLKMSQASDEPPQYKFLEIDIHTNPENPAQWIIRFNNRGWHFLSSIIVSHKDVLDLLASGLSKMDIQERTKQFGNSPLTELVPELKTKELMPKCSTTVILNKVPNFVPTATKTYATFHAVGGDEPFAMRYTVNVNIH